MRVNKSALVRYQAIDRCLRNTGRYYTIEDIQNECNKVLQELYSSEKTVSTRQIYDDIKFIADSAGYGAELIKIRENGKTYYRYKDPHFSINQTILSNEEVIKLKSAIDILLQFDGLPQFECLYEILPILQNKFALRAENKPVIEIHSNKDFSGLKYITTLYNAIVNKNVLKITYKRFFDCESAQFYFHPYYLREYNGRWFVYGLHEEENKNTWNLALDRIQEIELTNREYRIFDFDWESYFYDIVGVTRYNEEPQEITLKFYKDSAPYVVHKPLHPSQKVYYEGDNVIIKIKVIPNRELISQILGYGANVEVLSPSLFRQTIKNEIELMAQHYADRQ